MDTNVIRFALFGVATLVWAVCVFLLARSHGAAGWWPAAGLALAAGLAALVNLVESRRRGR